MGGVENPGFTASSERDQVQPFGVMLKDPFGLVKEYSTRVFCWNVDFG